MGLCDPAGERTTIPFTHSCLNQLQQEVFHIIQQATQKGLHKGVALSLTHIKLTCCVLSCCAAWQDTDTPTFRTETSAACVDCAADCACRRRVNRLRLGARMRWELGRRLLGWPGWRKRVALGWEWCSLGPGWTARMTSFLHLKTCRRAQIVHHVHELSPLHACACR